MSPPPTWSWLARLCQERAAPSPHPGGLGNGRTSVACSVFHIKLYYSATVPVHHIYSLKLPSLTERADLKLGPSTLPCRGASSLPRSIAARWLHCDMCRAPHSSLPLILARFSLFSAQPRLCGVPGNTGCTPNSPRGPGAFSTEPPNQALVTPTLLCPLQDNIRVLVPLLDRLCKRQVYLINKYE